LNDYVPKKVIAKKNSSRTWLYGYNDTYDMVVISKTGQIGEIVRISGLAIALPLAPDECPQRHHSASEQHWERRNLPKDYPR